MVPSNELAGNGLCSFLTAVNKLVDPFLPQNLLISSEHQKWTLLYIGKKFRIKFLRMKGKLWEIIKIGLFESNMKPRN